MIPSFDLHCQTEADSEEEDWWDYDDYDDENVILPEVEGSIDYSPSIYSDDGTDDAERHLMEHEALHKFAKTGNSKLSTTQDFDEAVQVWGQARVR